MFNQIGYEKHVLNRIEKLRKIPCKEAVTEIRKQKTKQDWQFWQTIVMKFLAYWIIHEIFPNSFL